MNLSSASILGGVGLPHQLGPKERFETADRDERKDDKERVSVLSDVAKLM